MDTNVQFSYLEAREEFWTTKDGRRIKIKDMMTDHLRNTINMLLRNKAKIEKMQREWDDNFGSRVELAKTLPSGDDDDGWDVVNVSRPEIDRNDLYILKAMIYEYNFRAAKDSAIEKIMQTL